MKRLFAAFALVSGLLVTAVSASAGAQQSATCESALKIGTWNIEWLGRPDQRKSKVDPKPADVASYIRASKVEVLSLNEISVTHRDPAGADRNRVLDETFALLSKDGGEWQYELYPKRAGSRDPQDQWLGVAWNTKIVSRIGNASPLAVEIDLAREQKLNDAMNPKGDGQVVLNRWPRAVKFSAGTGKTDFVVVPLHLKSNRGGEEATAQIRAYEIDLVKKGIERWRTEFADNDFILLGDFNTLRATEPLASALSTAGYRDCNTKDLKTYVSFQGGAPFDRIFVVSTEPETKTTCTAEQRLGMPLAFTVVRPAIWKQGATIKQFSSELSDHQMVTAGICVQVDDD
jgi:predicted extracellular nuclease